MEFSQMLFIFSYDSTLFLEWEIVCTTTGSWSSWLSWREWSCSTSSRSSSLRRSTHWREWSSTWLHSTHRTRYCVRIDALNIPCTNAVEPAALILVSIDIE